MMDVMNVIDWLESDFEMVKGIEEVDELVERGVEVWDDILEGEDDREGDMGVD